MLNAFKNWLRRKYLPEYNALLQEVEKMRADDTRARAQLMQLRVWNSGSVHGRTGFMVSAFVPQEVIGKLIEKPERADVFVREVANVLVLSAVKGLVHQATQGEVNAIIFSPPSFKEQFVAKVETRPHGDFVLSRKTLEEATAANLRKNLKNPVDVPSSSAMLLGNEAKPSQTEDRKKSVVATVAALLRKAKGGLLPKANKDSRGVVSRDQ